MFYSLMLILCAYGLASSVQKGSPFIEDRSRKRCGIIPVRSNEKLLYFLLVAGVSLFSGLRSRYNDTGNYVFAYLYTIEPSLSSLSGLPFEDGTGFLIYETIVKIFFGSNYARFLTVTAFITIGSFILFFRKYSSNFSVAVYLLITTTFFDFTMAAMRQCLAMAIVIWAIPCFIEKRYFRGVLCTLVAASIHQFSVLYLVMFFLMGDVWTIKTLMIIVATVFVSFSFTSIFNSVAEITGYSEADITGSGGTNILRTLVWLVPVALSFVFKNNINHYCDKYGRLFINLSLVGAMIMILASLGGANLLGRMAYYFYPLYILAVIEIIEVAMNKRDSRMLRYCCMVGFLMYFVVLSMGSGGFFEDHYRHNSIVDLFRAIPLER